MTDPQNDVPCRDCKRPTQHATERCDDCRTPAGRLVTALAARGVKAKADSRCDVSVDTLAITVDEEEWTISSVEATHAETVEAAANAIAAIVQAPGLRAMPADLTAIRALLASVQGFTPGPWHLVGFDALTADGENSLLALDVDGMAVVDRMEDARLIAAAPTLHARLTDLADEVERLRAHNAEIRRDLLALSERCALAAGEVDDV